jgi:hypothetical protein
MTQTGQTAPKAHGFNIERIIDQLGVALLLILGVTTAGATILVGF